jgi:hypothetical protein
MSPRIVERLDDWESVQFGGGYAGLQELASREFSGVVTAGTAQLCFIRGTVVGVLDGDIEDFAETGGTARTAPHPALPLLAVMQERSEEVRAKYYTEDTAIADVDRTLSEGNFTGYVELAENVLSGDYYQVYHQGRSMSIAVVGTAERLLTDDEAFENANDEVGIYEVRPVDIEPIKIPEPVDNESVETADTETTEPAATAVSDEPEDRTADDRAEPSTAASDVSADSAHEVSPAGPDASAPESEESAPQTASGQGGDHAAAEGDDSPDTDTDMAASTADDADAGASGDPTASAEPATEHADSATETSASTPQSEAETSPDSEPEPAQETAARTSREATDAAAADTTRDAQSTQPAGETGSPSQSGTNGPEPEASQDTEQPPRRQQVGTQHAETARSDSGANSPDSPADLETRAIPSLNPGRTASTEQERAVSGAGGTRDQRAASGQPTNAGAPSGQQSDTAGASGQGPANGGHPADANEGGQVESATDGATQTARTTAEQDAGPAESQPPSSAAAETDAGSPGDQSDSEPVDADSAGDATAEEIAELEQELADREDTLSDLRTKRDELEAERADLADTAEELRGERDRLESELETARADIERMEDRLAEAEAAGPAETEIQLGRADALEQTNLFVRYESKGEATLEAVHDGNASREAIAENLRLEYHTQFDADNAAVGAEPFETFLHSTIQYRFVEWLITSLLYEIRDTGHTDEMQDLYAALPKIDRAELNGEVSVTYTENGQETRSKERFDVVVRDRMGNPLVVANINNSRDPATNGMMTDLIQRGERVGESNDSLVAAVLVTESFFEPPALETADQATSSGLFSRNSRKSFVNLSRKDGYHLCLVEARNQEFHMAVPEL